MIIGNINNKVGVSCDVCGKSYKLTPKQHYDLEKEGYLVYCDKCAEKLNIDKWKAKKSLIKIYKM